MQGGQSTHQQKSNQRGQRKNTASAGGQQQYNQWQRSGTTGNSQRTKQQQPVGEPKDNGDATVKTPKAQVNGKEEEINPLTAFMNSNNSSQNDNGKKQRSKGGKTGGGVGMRKTKTVTESNNFDEVDEAIVCIEADAEPMMMSKSKMATNGDDGQKKPRQRNRELQKQTFSGAPQASDTLEEIIQKEGTGGFDQFKDRHTSYDDKHYTSVYDPSKLTAEQKRTAERVERELIAEESGNRHQLEERGILQVRDNEYDEEMDYSGVHRSAKKAFKSINKKLRKGKNFSFVDHLAKRAQQQVDKGNAQDRTLFVEWSRVLLSSKEKAKLDGKPSESAPAAASSFGDIKKVKPFVPKTFTPTVVQPAAQPQMQQPQQQQSYTMSANAKPFVPNGQQNSVINQQQNQQPMPIQQQQQMPQQQRQWQPNQQRTFVPNNQYHQQSYGQQNMQSKWQPRPQQQPAPPQFTPSQPQQNWQQFRGGHQNFMPQQPPLPIQNQVPPQMQQNQMNNMAQSFYPQQQQNFQQVPPQQHQNQQGHFRQNQPFYPNQQRQFTPNQQQQN